MLAVKPQARRVASRAAIAASLTIGLGSLAAVPPVLGTANAAGGCPIQVSGTNLAAAQAAVHNASGACHSIVFPAHTYVFSGSLRIATPGLTITAAPGAVFKSAGGSRMGDGLFTVAASHVTLNNVRVDVSASSGNARAISVRGNASDVLISGCSATGFGDRGIAVQGDSTTVKGCTVSGGSGIGISLFSGSNGSTLTGNEVSGVKGKGIEVSKSTNFTVSNNDIHDNHLLGIHLLRDSHGNVASNNIHNNQSNGIDAHGDTDITIQGNKAYKNGGPRFPETLEGNGIIVYCSQNVKVLNNTVWDNGQFQPGKRDGIRISDNNRENGEMPTRYVTVSGNTIYDDQAHHTQGWAIRLGLKVPGDLNYITVSNNNGHGNMDPGIFMKGLVAHATTTIVNNHLG